MNEHTAWIASRVLSSSNATERPIEIHLGAPERVSGDEWRCAYQLSLADEGNVVRFAHGEDSLQALLCAIVAIRAALDRHGAQFTWEGTDTSGIPRMIPQFFGARFAADLEAMVDSEVARFAADAKARSDAP